MRLKLVLLFFLTVLIPTALLVYFSLLAVRGEQEILEKNMKQKYQSMAQVVTGEVDAALKEIPGALRADPKVIEPALFKKTLLFQDEVMIFDRHGRAVDGVRKTGDFGTPAYSAPVGDLPYTIAVYERYPAISKEFKRVEERISEHFGIVGMSALAILLGGLFILGELFHEWRKTETKGEFIFHLAHDLKRPLTSVRMFSEMLEMGRIPSDEKRKEYYRILSSESEKLIHLIHNVLDFSRIEGRKKRYDLKPDDFTSVVTETVRRFQTYVENQTHRIRLEVIDTIPSLRMDAEAISQALMNLLFNATKYSPPGSDVQVVVSRQGRKATVSVIDQGIGISKRDQKKIFQEYFRGDDPEVKNREGSGLGLALVQYAVNAHGGKVGVKSKRGKGSEFKIELPIH